jgi:hypothetical protein
MPQPFDPLRRADQAARAAHIDFTFFRNSFGIAVRAMIGKGEVCPVVAARQVLDDLGNDIARALDQNTVSGADAQTRDLVAVVQRNV